MPQYLLGIDGGGTKTEFLLAGTDGEVYYNSFDEATNPNDYGMDRCIEVLLRNIKKIAAFVEKNNISIDFVYAGLSGGISGENQKKITEELIKNIHYKLCVDSDIQNAVASTLLYHDGCAVISGTGSVVFAKKGGVVKRIGGWGYLIDKSGSGFNLGADALDASFRMIDGRGEKTILKALIEEKINDNLEKYLGNIYIGGKTLIASFAPLVFEAFDKKDNAAYQIINRFTDYLSECILVAQDSINDRGGLVGFTGGVFNREDIILPLLREKIKYKFDYIISSYPPVFGAIIEAGKAVNIKFDKKFLFKLRDNYNEFNCKN